MVMGLQLPITNSLPSSSSSSSPFFLGPRNPRNFRTFCSFNAKAKAKIPVPPINPKDPFLSKLASVAATSPETLLDRPVNSESPPYLDLFDAPKLMATPAQVERSVSYNEHRPRRPPPDLPSLLLHGRIVYIGMPLVPAVTELVVAELMYLQWMDPKEPIYIYINSTGTTRDDGETVGMETEGFAIYDAMMQLKNEVSFILFPGLFLVVIFSILVAVIDAGSVIEMGFVGYSVDGCFTDTYSCCWGSHRASLSVTFSRDQGETMPHAKAMIQQPRVPSSGLMPASDVLIRAKEIVTNRDTLVKLLAKHTGNSEETVANVMRRPFYMDATKAKEFGVIDKVLWRGQEKIMSDVAPPEDWDKSAGIKVVDGL
ncbi:ATP-dependent Clp protease proteolytic subunit-related protein 3 [Morus notabilis]|uniref:ATP-dependent Clp protease proteolytic subunit n=1 Tax=Morus notabilis TaxID=981085 RepID=W9RNA6_9ROSA|nr:ATP-dependent Clp protease proteolytic subunit-related protein 3 [Morus notabilis]